MGWFSSLNTIILFLFHISFLKVKLMEQAVIPVVDLLPAPCRHVVLVPDPRCGTGRGSAIAES